MPIHEVHYGYGVAINNIAKSLDFLGHQITFNDPTTPVAFNWCQPNLFKMNRRQYQILYFPWESTQFKPRWLEICNGKGVDEVWTTSPWCKKIFEDVGVNKSIQVFNHGVGAEWAPRLRRRNGPVKYIIDGGPANRKGWQEGFDAFREVFKDDPTKATLTIKARQRSLVRWHDQRGYVKNPDLLPNVTVNTKDMKPNELIQLYRNHDVNIYASAGEGWGLIPHQSIATGMPTICTAEWAGYKDYLGDLALRSKYGITKWQGEHPGMMPHPDTNHLRELVQLSYDDFENQAEQFFARSFEVHERYDWIELTREAFAHVTNRF